MRTCVLVACVLLWSATAVHALQGPHVCSRNVVTQAKRTTLRYYMCPVQKIRRSYVDTETYAVNTVQQYCCDGYRQQGDRCEPVCTRGCVNGKCTAPGVCACNEGYRNAAAKGNARCVPVCASPCEHGVCTGPDKCTCSPRYRLKTGSSSVCVPVCTEGCVNGACTAPDKCTCNPGYEKDVALHRCKPKCSNGCVNGACTAPDKCTCNPGYEKDVALHRCKPKCSQGCVNGACTAPDKCVCDELYVTDAVTGGCVPEVIDVEPE